VSTLLIQAGAVALGWLIFCAAVEIVDRRSGLAAKMPCFDFPTPWPENSLFWLIPNLLYFKAKQFNLRIQIRLCRLKHLVFLLKLRYSLFKTRHFVASKCKPLAKDRAELELADEVSEQGGDLHALEAAQLAGGGQAEKEAQP
jgi:hypothetical protein